MRRDRAARSSPVVAGVVERTEACAGTPGSGGGEDGGAAPDATRARAEMTAALADICRAVRELAAPEADLPRVVEGGRERLRRIVEAGRGDPAFMALQDMGMLVLDAFEALSAAMSQSRAEAVGRERALCAILDRVRHALKEGASGEDGQAAAERSAEPADDPDGAGSGVLPMGVALLTEREREVLRAMVAGMTTSREIAEKLVIQRGTAKKHVNHILAKLGVKSRGEAVRRAREAGW